MLPRDRVSGRRRRTSAAVSLAAACGMLGWGGIIASEPSDAPKWVASWGSAQQVPEPRNALPARALRDATLREIVHLTLGGTAARIRFSNAFGTSPLQIDSAHIARAVSPESGEMDAASDRAVTFSGQSGVTIPAGAEYLSDPVQTALAPQSDLAVSFHLPVPPERQTGHPGSRETSFLVRGDAVSAARLASAMRIEHWYFLSGVEVEGPPQSASIVALGDSITDGRGSTTDGNDRWPDDLARRLAARPPATDPQCPGRLLAVVNAGIGGNRLLEDGGGPNALARFDRDVLGQARVHSLIVLEGINDLGVATEHGLPERAHRELVARVTRAYAQLVARAHAHHIRVMGGTLTPDTGSSVYHPDAAAEADRQAINLWIRAPGHFDAVVDFDAVLRDSMHPDRLAPGYDSGDHLHPSPAGYRAMAAAIPLAFFQCSIGSADSPVALLHRTRATRSAK